MKPNNGSGLTCFKTYDVRGRIGVDLDEDIARRIGRAAALALKARRLAVGCDIRLSSPALKQALAKGMMEAGTDVIDLGLTGTEEIYFASMALGVEGGVQVTASHNPADYNGFKFVGAKGLPLSIAGSFAELKNLAENPPPMTGKKQGTITSHSLLAPYVDHLLKQVNLDDIRPLTILVDAGNGAAGHAIDAIEERFRALSVPINFIKINHEADGHFPNGVPNPLLPGNRALTSAAVRDAGADLGIAWDGDFDRCFFYDHRGNYVSGYYTAGLLSAQFLEKEKGARIAVDSRLNWNSYDLINAAGGTGIPSRTGHMFFKEVMRQNDAIYGGEVSAHHYFRSFAYCDSGMLPWLAMVEYLSRHKAKIADAVAERIKLYPSSEEINFKVANPQGMVLRLLEHYTPMATRIDRLDGASIEIDALRFNLRASNTEHMLRLNVEAKGDAAAVTECVSEITNLVTRFASSTD